MKDLTLKSKGTAGVSNEFKGNLDDVKKKIAEKYKNIKFDETDTETAREFKQRKPGRRKTRVSDKVEDLGSNLSVEDIETKFLKGADKLSKIVTRALEQPDDVDKPKSRYRYNRLNKYIFTDSFGEKVAVFFDRTSKKHLNRVADIQMNCVDEVGKADGLMWRVFGLFEDEDYYYTYNLKEIGLVNCVGLGNAFTLGKAMCVRNGCELFHIKYLDKETVLNGRR